MTERVKRRKRPETVDQRYDRLNRRIVRQLPVTAAETAFVWRETSRRLRIAHRTYFASDGWLTPEELAAQLPALFEVVDDCRPTVVVATVRQSRGPEDQLDRLSELFTLRDLMR